MQRNLLAVAAVLAAAALIQTASGSLSIYANDLLILAGIHATLAVSLNLVNGINGQFSLGHAGFMAVGAYSAAAVSKLWLSGMADGSFVEQQLAVILSLAVAGGVAALAGLLVGLPSLRLRGDYLAIVTLGFGEIIRVMLFNTASLGGATGLKAIPVIATPFWVYLVLIAVTLQCWRYMNSTHGRALLAIRENEIAAESMGVDTTRYKVIAFVASSAAAGVAGGLFGLSQSFITPSTFGFLKSVEIVIMVVMGGMGSMTGALLAGLGLTILPEALRPLQEWTGVDLRMVIYSLALIAMMLWRPQGLFGNKEIWDYIKKWRGRHE
jgi:branched-chain amino acid transport system permease protein